jgi:hypothetical protein
MGARLGIASKVPFRTTSRILGKPSKCLPTTSDLLYKDQFISKIWHVTMQLSGYNLKCDSASAVDQLPGNKGPEVV